MDSITTFKFLVEENGAQSGDIRRVTLKSPVKIETLRAAAIDILGWPAVTFRFKDQDGDFVTVASQHELDTAIALASGNAVRFNVTKQEAVPVPVPQAAPQPAPQPAPEPVSEPEPEPSTIPGPSSEEPSDSEPVPEHPEPEHEHEKQLESEPEPEPQPESEPEPEPEPEHNDRSETTEVSKETMNDIAATSENQNQSIDQEKEEVLLDSDIFLRNVNESHHGLSQVHGPNPTIVHIIK